MRAMLRAAVAACLLILPGVAAGADLGGPYVPPPQAAEAAPAFKSGPYIGAVAGYDLADIEAAGFSFSGSAVQAGAFVGWQQQMRGYVFGLEGDFVYADIKAATLAGLLSAQNHYLATIRGRVGVPLGPTMVYATVGPAFTNQSTTIAGVTANSMLVGIAYGGGVELDISKTVFARLEALHYDFPEQNVGLLSSTDQQTTIRAGLGMRF